MVDSGALLGVLVAVVVLLCSCLLLMNAITATAITATAAIEAAGDHHDPAPSWLAAARRSSCRSSLRLAVARRCSLVGTAVCPPCVVSRARVRQLRLMWAPRPVSSGPAGGGKLGTVLITGFPAGMLQCNCYVLAERPGADAVIVDPGQRVMGPLRRILDENRLTPAAVLLTHGHIDHIWSAQKVSDTYGCPTYIHPEDRFMLTDPIHGFGPRIGSAGGGRLLPRAQAGGRAGPRRRQARPRRRDRHRRSHARAHPRFGGLPGRSRRAGRKRRRLHRRHAVRALGRAAPTCPAAAAATC